MNRRKRMQRWNDLERVAIWQQVRARGLNPTDHSLDEWLDILADNGSAMECPDCKGTPPEETIDGVKYRLGGLMFDKEIAGFITEALVPVDGGDLLLRHRRLVSGGTDEVVTYQKVEGEQG